MRSKVVSSGEVGANGASQAWAHGLPGVPSLFWAEWTKGGAANIQPHCSQLVADATNITVTATGTAKYIIHARL